MRIVEGIWLFLAAVWLIAASRAKKVERRQSFASRLGQVVVLGGAFLALTGDIPYTGILADRFVPESGASIAAGVIVTALGAALAIWARLILGSNWSGTVTVKHGHELVRRGPYRAVRHPIYSGLLLATLGTAIAVGELRGLLGLVLACAGFWWKSRTEETFMQQEFGDRYTRYQHEVKALIPYLL
ncbi:MAG TPA: methyltransferase [Bryobacteraceae bacterium]|nr:methyltransferase [Bryobacteraceae bacterium]